ncbi:MAG: ABC transporter substrate-binding protein [Lachnospiraceae bacterium]|nr:ABC transporter substrate-binding protein [Lachnospiraceae bacterium]
MKKYVLAALVSAAAVLCLAGCGGKSEKVLNVYNWGEYISDGSEDSYDTVAEFEKWYEEEYGKKVTVNYDTFASNEDMYAKISTGAVSYDVIIPSDYMIARMQKEDLLLPLNFDNIPNYKNIDESFRGLYYDPDDKYSIPYAYGVVGIIYNANEVDPADAVGWDLMWNEKYAGRILQFNNSRDAFGTAAYRLGLSVNSTDKADWDAEYAELMKQQPLRYGLVMDEIFNLMESGEAAIGAYYAGDYFIMEEAEAENVDLRFYYPDPTNYYIDAMCIPKCCADQELAEIFINFMLDHDAAVANASFTCYASPNRIVYTDPGYIDEMGDEAMEILYPPMDDFSALYNEYAYRNLDQDTLNYINELWEEVKIN